MKKPVFICWSGPVAKQVAEALYEWLPLVIQAIDPWISSEEIDPGTRWREVLAHKLEEHALGIVCLTADNLVAPWIHFEAGALAKSVNGSRVIPYLFGISDKDLGQGNPLTQFQVTQANREGTCRLVECLNRQLPDEQKLNDGQLQFALESGWGTLEQRLTAVETSQEPETALHKRTPDELAEETLESVRALARVVEWAFQELRSSVGSLVAGPDVHSNWIPAAMIDEHGRVTTRAGRFSIEHRSPFNREVFAPGLTQIDAPGLTQIRTPQDGEQAEQDQSESGNGVRTDDDEAPEDDPSQ